MIVAGIDQGTTSTKGIVLADDGQMQEIGGIRHNQHLPRPGWVEHDPRELLSNVRALVEIALLKGANGIALANQGETVVAWNRDTGEPLYNALVWQDQRTVAEIDALKTAGRETEVTARSGLPLDAYFSASKMAWILNNVDGARALARAGRLGLGTSDAYFVERLTGRYATDATTAGRTSLLNLDILQWDPVLCDLFGVPIETLPEIASSSEVIGEIATPSGTVPLLASMVDQVAALYGHGCRTQGDCKVTFGTGAFALAITGAGRSREPVQGVIPAVCWPSRQGMIFAADGGVYTAAAAVDWLRRLGIIEDISEISQLEGPSAAERDLFFVPALAGLACPHWDRSAVGLWIGMDMATERTDLIKAVLEGVAFRTAEVLDALGVTNAKTGALSVDGGLARSSYFTAFFSGITQRSLVSRGEAELTAIGAAQLGRAVATGSDPAASPASGTGEDKMVSPAIDAASVSAWRARFTEARLRAGQWRR